MYMLSCPNQFPYSGSRHKFDTLGGVFCFLGCPRTPKSQTGCPRGHPKILQGCPFDTQKKLRVSPVLVGPMALNFILIKCFSKKIKKNLLPAGACWQLTLLPCFTVPPRGPSQLALPPCSTVPRGQHRGPGFTGARPGPGAFWVCRRLALCSAARSISALQHCTALCTAFACRNCNFRLTCSVLK